MDSIDRHRRPGSQAPTDARPRVADAQRHETVARNVLQRKRLCPGLLCRECCVGNFTSLVYIIYSGRHYARQGRAGAPARCACRASGVLMQASCIGMPLPVPAQMLSRSLAKPGRPVGPAEDICAPPPSRMPPCRPRTAGAPRPLAGGPRPGARRAGLPELFALQSGAIVQTWPLSPKTPFPCGSRLCTLRSSSPRPVTRGERVGG